MKVFGKNERENNMNICEASEILKRDWHRQGLSECPKCGAPSDESLLANAGDEPDYDAIAEASWCYDFSRNNAVVCGACGYDEGEEAEEARALLDNTIDCISDRLIAVIEELGGEAETESSGLSEARYIMFLDAAGNEAKIRIAAHEARPTYEMLNGASDCYVDLHEIRSAEQLEMYVKECEQWIRDRGVFVDED